MAAKFPALRMLSAMRNPCCPFLKPDAGPDAYRRYRLRVLHRLPGLLSLDGTDVTAEERDEARFVSEHKKHRAI